MVSVLERAENSFSSESVFCTPKATALLFINFNFNVMQNTEKSPVQTINEQKISIQEFNIEMNAKNKAYAFILSHKLLDDFSRFCKANTVIENAHPICLTLLNESL